MLINVIKTYYIILYISSTTIPKIDYLLLDDLLISPSSRLHGNYGSTN